MEMVSPAQGHLRTAGGRQNWGPGLVVGGFFRKAGCLGHLKGRTSTWAITGSRRGLAALGPCPLQGRWVSASSSGQSISNQEGFQEEAGCGVGSQLPVTESPALTEQKTDFSDPRASFCPPTWQTISS